MTSKESSEILRYVEAALQIYWRNEGKLSAQEIRVKSLLSVARAELIDEQMGAGYASKRGRDLDARDVCA